MSNRKERGRLLFLLAIHFVVIIVSLFSLKTRTKNGETIDGETVCQKAPILAHQK